MSISVSNVNAFLQSPAGSGGQPGLFYPSLFQNSDAVQSDGSGNATLDSNYLSNVAYLVQQQQASINLAGVTGALPQTSNSPSAAAAGNSSAGSPLVTHDYSVPLGLYAQAVSNLVNQQQSSFAVTETSNAVQNLLQAAAPPAETSLAGLGGATAAANFAQGNVNSIADVLQNANGLTSDGSLSNALQAQSTGSASSPDANAILASVLNPSVDPNSSGSSQVADFIDTSPNAFPTMAPADIGASASSTPDNNQNTGSNTGGFSQSAPAPTAIYNAIANANASTIRGTSVNTVA